MVRIKSIIITILVLAGATISGTQAYYVRQLAPGWPPEFHAQPGPRVADVVEIPVDRLQHIGLVLVLAILCLIGLALGIGRKAK